MKLHITQSAVLIGDYVESTAMFGNKPFRTETTDSNDDTHSAIALALFPRLALVRANKTSGPGRDCTKLLLRLTVGESAAEVPFLVFTVFIDHRRLKHTDGKRTKAHGYKIWPITSYTNAVFLNDESTEASADIYLSLWQMFTLQSQPVPLKEFTA